MKFILTPELGRLAKWLRILGFDAVYSAEVNFSSLLIHALRNNRIILTRNSHFILKAQMTKAVWIKSNEVNQQLKQVIKELNLKPEKDLMFSRCIICNIELESVNRQHIKDRVPEYVFKTQQKFFVCPRCQRVYWSGTHWGNVSEALKSITNSN